MKEGLDQICLDRDISVFEGIDIYVSLALSDLESNITKMIVHDVVCNKKDLNCLIDSSQAIKIRNDMLRLKKKK